MINRTALKITINVLKLFPNIKECENVIKHLRYLWNEYKY